MKEYKYLEPQAKKAIDMGRKKKAGILMMVDGYISDEEALILRDMLWYARDNGVEIRMIPKPKGGEKD
jgi:hypothetical protein